VNIIGLTRGKDTKFHHTRNWIRVKFLLPSLPIILSAIKIRGKARILSRHGEVYSGE